MRFSYVSILKILWCSCWSLGMISNLGCSSGSSSSDITVITIINSFLWNPCQYQRRSIDNMESIKAAILKLKVKTKSHHKLLEMRFSRWSPSPDWNWKSELSKIIKLTSKMNLSLPKYHINHKSLSTLCQIVENSIFKMATIHHYGF